MYRNTSSSDSEGSFEESHWILESEVSDQSCEESSSLRLVIDGCCDEVESHLPLFMSLDPLHCTSLSHLIDDLREKRTRLRLPLSEIGGAIEWHKVRRDVWVNEMELFTALDMPKDMVNDLKVGILQFGSPCDENDARLVSYMHEIGKLIALNAIHEDIHHILEDFENACKRYVAEVELARSEIRKYPQDMWHIVDAECKTSIDPFAVGMVRDLNQLHRDGELSDEEHIIKLAELCQDEYQVLHFNLQWLWRELTDWLKDSDSDLKPENEVEKHVDVSILRSYHVETSVMFEDWAMGLTRNYPYRPFSEVSRIIEEMRCKLQRKVCDIDHQRTQQIAKVEQAMRQCPIRQVYNVHRGIASMCRCSLAHVRPSRLPAYAFEQIEHYHSECLRDLEARLYEH